MSNIDLDPFKIDFSKIIFLQDINTKGLKHFLIHLCTAIGAWGGYPSPPVWWSDLVNSHEIVKWFLLTVLIFQGGDDQNLQMAIEFTVMFYVLYKFSNHFYKMVKPQVKNITKKVIQTRHSFTK